MCHAMTPRPLTSPASDPSHASRQVRAAPLRGNELNLARAMAGAALAAGYSARRAGRLLAAEGLVASFSVGERIAQQLVAEDRAHRRALVAARPDGQAILDRIDRRMAELDAAPAADPSPSDQKEAA